MEVISAAEACTQCIRSDTCVAKMETGSCKELLCEFRIEHAICFHCPKKKNNKRCKNFNYCSQCYILGSKKMGELISQEVMKTKIEMLDRDTDESEKASRSNSKC